MLDIDHEGNVIDVNKKGGRLAILLSEIAFSKQFFEDAS